MASIAEATRARRSERRRFVVGVGFLSVGAVLVGLGAAGAVGAATVEMGAAVGGLAVLGCLAGLAVRASPGRRELMLAVAGGVVGSVSLIGFWWSTTAGAILATVVAAIGSLLGLSVLGAAVLAAATMRPRRDASRVAWTRSADGRHARESMADGGSADDELTFHLDDD